MVMINKIRNIASWFLMSTDKFQKPEFSIAFGFCGGQVSSQETAIHVTTSLNHVEFGEFFFFFV